MAAITPIGVIDLTGDTKTFQAAAGPDTFVNDGKTLLYMRNTNAAARNVTCTMTKPCDTAGVLHTAVINVGATTGDEIAGPFPVAIWGTSVTVTYDAITNLTVAAMRMP